MQRKKPIEQPGQKNNRRDHAKHVDALFSRSASTPSAARMPAPMKLDKLPDEICAWCAKPFEPTRASNVFCSRRCTSAEYYSLERMARAKQRAELKCVDCNAPITGAKRADKKFCAACKRTHRLENLRASRRREAEGNAGLRGTNQYENKGINLALEWRAVV
ncbi:MAG: hypothetical protein EKK29_09495 [Hyphomicrobiales bacterium]|nr:MAG: hypothetical protein EKK29_09495 [Hyphomicrobiales bacterium]